jgi:hypothetical protein
VIIYGLITAGSVLATKHDLCATCNVAGPHAIVRRSRWAEIFFIPVAPVWVNHRLICGNCGAETKLGFGQVRRALREGKLPLGPRANFPAYVEQLYEAGERRPSESEFDPIEPNPRPGGWNLALKAWPIVAVLVIAALVFVPPLLRGPEIPVANAGHDCWMAADGSISGCRMHDGTVVGEAVGEPTRCYFVEPMPTGEYTLTCRN